MTEARADFVKFRLRQIGSELVVGDYTEGFQSAVSSRFSVAPGISLCLGKIAHGVRRPSKDKIIKLLLFAAGLLCLMGVARGSDEEQLVREVVKALPHYTKV